MNCVNIIGRVSQSPRLDETSSGTKVATFEIAVKKEGKVQPGDKDCYFFRVKVYAKTAAFAESYVQKSNLVGIAGKLATRQWTDHNGSQRESFEIVADTLEILDRGRISNIGSVNIDERKALQSA